MWSLVLRPLSLLLLLPRFRLLELVLDSDRLAA
jgi:hypothetical protein